MARLHSAASRAALLLIMSGLILLTLSTGVDAQAPTNPAVAAGDPVAAGAAPTVDILSVDGYIDGTVVNYLRGALEDAAASDVEVVVLELNSTGLLNVTLDEALTPLLDPQVPVVVWVGPPGARSTGGAAWLAAAADVIAVAPGALLGSAAQVPEAVSQAADGGAAAQVRTRLDERGLFEQAVVPTTQAETTLPPDVALPPGVGRADVRIETDTDLVASGTVDLVAGTLQEVLVGLDGRVVTVGDAERTLDVDAVTANVRFNNQGLWGRVLHAAANPTLAYLLLIAGLMAVAFEFFQPGFGVAGLSGLLTAGLATYGLVVLPTRPLMAALIVVGLALLAVDLAMAGLGLVTFAGAAALAVGSLGLYGDGMSVPVWLVALVVVFALVFFVGIMTTVLRAQGGQARAGAALVAGKLGVVRSMLNPEGHVFVDGALWRARAPESAGKVKTGTTVRVIGTSDGLTLDVELVDDSERAPVA